MSEKKNKILTVKFAPYTLINGFLYKLGLNEIHERCPLEHERDTAIDEAHNFLVGGH